MSPTLESRSAASSFAAEAFTLLSIGIFIILLRTYARARLVGISNLEADDYLMLLVLIPYVTETSLAYSVSHSYGGLSNSAMTAEQRAALSPHDEQYQWRVNGSKIQVAGWIMYASVLWLVKASLAAFYFRLTAGLVGYRSRIWIGVGGIAATYLALVITYLFSCHPIHKFWQINPDPGNLCQPAASKLYIFLTVVLNMVTDIYLLLIPLPMLWAAQIPTVKKAGLIVLFSGGVFIMVAGLLRCVLILKNPQTGPAEGAAWAVRESFVAVFTSSMPMCWGWIRQRLRPFLGSMLSSDNKYKTGREPGSIPLGDTNDRTTWRSQNKNSLKSANRGDASSNATMFMHAGEASSDEIIPQRYGTSGIKKEVEYTVQKTKAAE